MPDRLAFSKQHPELQHLARWYKDAEKSLRLYFKGKRCQVPFLPPDGLIDTRALTARKKPLTGCLRLAHPIYWRHGITGRRG
jgi:hypothetical protein